MIRRVLLAVFMAHVVASYASDFLFAHELSLLYGKEDFDPSLIWSAPVFVPIRYLTVIMNTLLNGPETFAQREYRLPFAVYLVSFGICYVIIRRLQDRLFTRRSPEPSGTHLEIRDR